MVFDVVERFNQEIMYGLSAGIKKSGPYWRFDYIK